MPQSAHLFGLLPLRYRGAVQRLAADYAGVFGGRDAELAALDHFLAQDEQPFAFLQAPTGRGKTALLLHWVQALAARDNWATIFIPISRRYQTASARATLGALAEALASFFGETAQISAMTPDQLRPLIADYLHRSVTGSRKLLLVLDGLDEAVGWSPGPELFPQRLGAGIRISRRPTRSRPLRRSYPRWLRSKSHCPELSQPQRSYPR